MVTQTAPQPQTLAKTRKMTVMTDLGIVFLVVGLVLVVCGFFGVIDSIWLLIGAILLVAFRIDVGLMCNAEKALKDIVEK